MPLPLYRKGDELGEGLHLNRWKVVRKIGEGQFAEVYEVIDAFKDNKRCAFKVERTLEAKTVKAEARVLKALQSCLHVVRLVEQGSIDGRSFMVMELLGMNVSDARRSCSTNGRWGVDIMKHIGQHMLESIAGVHKLGFIHRDIKPANFALTPRHAPPSEGAWHVLDFGLARKFVEEDGSVIAPRDRKEFRGSTSYASVAAHKLQDLGRRDDLWSWLYVLVEMLDGTLPWRGFTADRGVTQHMKEECVASPHQLCSHVVMPEPLVEISNHLARLSFADAPDYGFLRVCLDRLAVPAKLPASASAGSLMPELDGYLPAYSLPARTAALASGAPGSHASVQTPDSIPDFLTSEPANGHHLPEGGAIPPSRSFDAGFGAGLHLGDGNGVHSIFIADTPRSPPEESDLLYDDLPGVSSAPPSLPVGTPPAAALPSPLVMMPMAKPAAQQAQFGGQTLQEAAGHQGVLPSLHSLQRSAGRAEILHSLSQQLRGEVMARDNGNHESRRGTGSPAARLHDRGDRDSAGDELRRKRRASADARRGGDEGDAAKEFEKRREADGDRPWKEADRRRVPEYDSGRDRDARRRREPSERQQTDRAASSSHAPQSAWPSSPRFPKIKQWIGRVRVGHVKDAALQAHGALQGVEELGEGIGVTAAFIEDRLLGLGARDDRAGALRLLGELKAFVAEQEDRCRTSLS